MMNTPTPFEPVIVFTTTGNFPPTFFTAISIVSSFVAIDVSGTGISLSASRRIVRYLS